MSCMRISEVAYTRISCSNSAWPELVYTPAAADGGQGADSCQPSLEMVPIVNSLEVPPSVCCGLIALGLP
jgi:hypothetical protein